MNGKHQADPAEASIPSNLAVECAVSIANYCLTRFPCDTPPHQMLDVPWFAEKVQRCVDRYRKELDAQTKRADVAVAECERLRTRVRELEAVVTNYSLE